MLKEPLAWRFRTTRARSWIPWQRRSNPKGPKRRGAEDDPRTSWPDINGRFLRRASSVAVASALSWRSQLVSARTAPRALVPLVGVAKMVARHFSPGRDWWAPPVRGDVVPGAKFARGARERSAARPSGSGVARARVVPLQAAVRPRCSSETVGRLLPRGSGRGRGGRSRLGLSVGPPRS